MNKGIVRFVLGRIMLVEAGLLLFPLIVGLIYGEGFRTVGGFLITIGILIALGLSIGLKSPKSTRFYTKEGLVIAGLSWFILSVFGCLPFLISGEVTSFADALFETASGFTTTGSSILTDVEAMSRSLLFWRSFTHLIGGMGVIVLALAVLPATSSESVHIMKAEVPGPTFGKLVSKLKDTARILYIIYLSMTAVLIVLLVLGGMDLFDAALHAFGAAGTGGFGIKASGVLYYNSAYIETVLGIAMLAFGVNFYVYYLILIRQAKRALRNEAALVSGHRYWGGRFDLPGPVQAVRRRAAHDPGCVFHCFLRDYDDGIYYGGFRFLAPAVAMHPAAADVFRRLRRVHGRRTENIARSHPRENGLRRYPGLEGATAGFAY